LKIAHLCLSCFYIDGYSYQENELVKQHVKDGHDVVVIASTEVFDEQRQLNYCSPGEYMGSDGARVIRLPYRRGLPLAVMKKLRMHPDVAGLLEREAPDVILFHGLCGWELLALKRYKARHLRARIFADSHEDFNNSARSIISKHLLHRWYYKPILHRVKNSLEKVLCISTETMDFVQNFYQIPPNQIEFFPLGGRILTDEEYNALRISGRARHGIDIKEILFVQSGKIDRAKKLIETLQAFSKTPDERFRFIIAGHIHEDLAADVDRRMINDSRVKFVGWQTADQLHELLCAADVYVQPGSQSATMQTSLCARCAVVLDDVPSHHPFVHGNGWLLNPQTSIEGVFEKIAEKPGELALMSTRSGEVAARLLDYRVMAKRLTAPRP
jgi:1,2-diacylglycerol 3-alpha-glucosyltransferase